MDERLPTWEAPEPTLPVPPFIGIGATTLEHGSTGARPPTREPPSTAPFRLKSGTGVADIPCVSHALVMEISVKLAAMRRRRATAGRAVAPGAVPGGDEPVDAGMTLVEVVV